MTNRLNVLNTQVTNSLSFSFFLIEHRQNNRKEARGNYLFPNTGVSVIFTSPPDLVLTTRNACSAKRIADSIKTNHISKIVIRTTVE